MKKYLVPFLFIAVITGCFKAASDSITQEKAPQFVGSESCKSCHSNEYDKWKGSDHDWAMKTATDTTVLANFNNTEFTHNGVTSKFFIQDGKYMVNTQNNEGEYQDFEVSYTFGYEPLQQFLVVFPNGAYQCLMTAWDTEKEAWFQLQDTLQVTPDDHLHWTGGGLRWNTMCADCHSTDLKKNYNDSAHTFNTTWSEINVGCEGCHGPSSNHVEHFKQNESGNGPELYMSKNMDSKELVDKCARCHSRRSQITPYFDYQGHFTDHYEPSLITTPLYHADGQIRDEVYVYGSFVQSKMYHNGIACRDCHDVHTTKIKKQGNDLCLSCHVPKYATEEHHMHEMGSTGAECRNCHMTGNVYMGNDFRPDHSFRVPRPDQSAIYGTPNACNECHSDQSPEWAAKAVIDHYGTERADHFTDHLLPGYFGNKEELMVLAHGTNYPEIARATALNYYISYPLTEEEITDLRSFVNDSQVMVRNEAMRSLTQLNVDAIPEATKLLLDSNRLVRTTAVRYLILTGNKRTNDSVYNAVAEEYKDILDINADFPSGQIHKAQYEQAIGNTDAAIKAYREAIAMDKFQSQAKLNLALLLYQKGNVSEAKDLYIEVTQYEPNASYPYYMLGLLEFEQNNAGQAIRYLKQACSKQPYNPRAFYNLALIYQENKQFKESVELIDQALSVDPQNEDLIYVKLIGQMEMKDYENALSTCTDLLVMDQQNTNYLRAYRMIQMKLNPQQ